MADIHAIKESNKITPYMVMFIIHPIQIGVGILSFQHDIVKYAGYDAWISVILAGLATHALLWIIYSILNKGEGDIIEVHRHLFGKWVGGLFSFIYLMYFLSLVILSIRTYAMVVQVWMFPSLGTWFIALMMLFLAYYAITGGFRVVVGISFFGFLIPFLGVSWAFGYPMQFMNWENMLPIWSHPLPDILRSTKEMTLSYIGFCVLFMTYPFIKKPRSSQKWAHLANLFTMLIYLFIIIVSFGYFSESLLEKTIWPTLTMMKIVQFPFLARFEHFFIPVWLLTMLPNVILTLWVVTRGGKELFKIKQRHLLIAMVVVAFGVSLIFQDRQSVSLFNKKISMFAFYFLYAYLPILWIIQFVKGKVKKPS